MSGIGNFIHELFSKNPYFSAGFGLLGVGVGLAAFRQGISHAIFMLQQRYITTLEVSSKDSSYYWVLNWLSTNHLHSGSHFSVQTRLNKDARESFIMTPSPGVHYLRWDGHWIKVKRERERSAMLDLSTGLPFETVAFSTVGAEPNVFMRLLQAARTMAQEQETGKLVLYTNFAAEWRLFGSPRRPRPLSSVILKAGVSERIVDDVRDFLANSRWYMERGVPYRRGYLLHGPPGGGKSSFVQALASDFGYSICILGLADGVVTDDRLNHLLNSLPEKSILLLEDIDAAMNNNAGATNQRLTLSGLLNALDGVASSEERIIFMTTNRFDILDPALIRPGRTDLIEKIDNADSEQAERMFKRFYPGQDDLAKQFAGLVSQKHPSPAAVQGHFIRHKSSPVDAIAFAENLFVVYNKNHD